MTKSIWEGLGSGYISEDGTICMVRCFQCGQENYGMAVASGTCGKCGYSPNKNPDISTGVSKNQNEQDPSD